VFSFFSRFFDKSNWEILGKKIHFLALNSPFLFFFGKLAKFQDHKIEKKILWLKYGTIIFLDSTNFAFISKILAKFSRSQN
jgi:hypothetical protein